MSGRRGALFVEILVVVVIIAVLAAAYLGLMKKSSLGGDDKSTPKAAMDKARGVECANNLRQLRSMMQMEMAENESYPAALDPNSAMARCPVSNKPYGYDPKTGRIWCLTSGHETF